MMNTAGITCRRLEFLIVFVAAFLGFSSVHAAPVLWGGNGHLYEVISNDGVLWNTARANALALGAPWDLASITSPAEQAFIVTLLPAVAGSRDHYWIGGTDGAIEGDWEWVDGETWEDGFSYEN